MASRFLHGSNARAIDLAAPGTAFGQAAESTWMPQLSKCGNRAAASA